MTQEEKQVVMDKAKVYAEKHSVGQYAWVRDMLYVAYLSAIQEYTKTRLL